jgi:5-hydroxyisourate hydrolase/2-oxo-4-hydroxy-4-carboxy-5-ureidoimidazoline decarboxylase
LTLELIRLDGDLREILGEGQTNYDGLLEFRTLDPLSIGVYEILFHVGTYFDRRGIASFYDLVPVRFRIDDASSRYHVPLILSPYSYMTYRGN